MHLSQYLPNPLADPGSDLHGYHAAAPARKADPGEPLESPTEECFVALYGLYRRTIASVRTLEASRNHWDLTNLCTGFHLRWKLAPSS